MAKQAVAAAESKPGLLERLRTFWNDVRSEMKKVTWPGWDDLRVSTHVTLLLLGIMAAITFFYDQVFQFIVIHLLEWAS